MHQIKTDSHLPSLVGSTIIIFIGNRGCQASDAPTGGNSDNPCMVQNQFWNFGLHAHFNLLRLDKLTACDNITQSLG